MAVGDCQSVPAQYKILSRSGKDLQFSLPPFSLLVIFGTLTVEFSASYEESIWWRIIGW
jgi:hypothetical protein